MKKMCKFFIFLPLIILAFSICAATKQNSNVAKKLSITQKITDKIEPPININKADVKTLASLKGIGEKKAAAIVAYRKQHGDFKSINELAKVRGISAHTLRQIQKKNESKLTIK